MGYRGLVIIKTNTQTIRQYALYCQHNTIQNTHFKYTSWINKRCYINIKKDYYHTSYKQNHTYPKPFKQIVTTKVLTYMLYTSVLVIVLIQFINPKKILHQYLRSTSNIDLQYKSITYSNGTFILNDVRINKKPRSLKDVGNYTQFDLHLSSMLVTPDIHLYLDGKGIISKLKATGITGVIDRTLVQWDDNDDPRNYLNVHKPGDFEIQHFEISNCKVEVKDFKTFYVNIYNMEVPVLRKHWLFYDLLNADAVNGTYDGAMFSVYRKNSMSSTKSSQLRIDHLDIMHLNYGVPGPLSWVKKGKVDIVADIVVPNQSSVKQYIDEVKKQLNNGYNNGNKVCKIYFKMTLHNVQAEVPFVTNDISYINNALIRPIVAYINSKNTLLSVRCYINKDMNDFAGAWTIYDSLLMDNLQQQVYNAFIRDLQDDENKLKRMKRVGVWSLEMVLQFILLCLKNIA